MTERGAGKRTTGSLASALVVIQEEELRERTMAANRATVVAGGLAVGVFGFGAGYLVFSSPPAKEEFTGRPTSNAPPPAVAERTVVRGSDEQDTAGLANAIDRLTKEVASLEAAISKRPRPSGGGQLEGASAVGDVGCTRGATSPAPPPNEDHLKELETWESDVSSRRKWMFMSGVSALDYFGTPTRVWTAQGVSAEFWDYDLGGGRTRTLVFNGGRLIEVRSADSTVVPR